MKCEIMVDFRAHSGVHNKTLPSVRSPAQPGLRWGGGSASRLGSSGAASERSLGCATSVSCGDHPVQAKGGHFPAPWVCVIDTLYLSTRAIVTKYHIGWLKQQKCTFSQFWMLEVQDQGSDRFCFWWRPSPCLADQYLLALYSFSLSWHLWYLFFF